MDQISDLIQSLCDRRLIPTFRPFSFRDLTYVNETQATISNVKVDITPWGLKQLLKCMGVPPSFFIACGGELKQDILMEWREKATDPAGYKLRIVNDKITAVLPTTFAETRLESILGMLPNWKYLTDEFDVEAEIVSIKLFDDNATVLGDTVHGLELIMSELGSIDLHIEASLISMSQENGIVRCRPGGKPYYLIGMNNLVDGEFKMVGGLVQERLRSEHDACVMKLKEAVEDQLSAKSVVEGWLEMKVPSSVPKKTLDRLSFTGQDTMSRWELAMLVSNVGKEYTWKTRRHFERTAGKLLRLSINSFVN